MKIQKKIDSILKERLVLSKVRYGIIKQQEERQRRKKREDVLEKDKDSKNYDIEKPESKKRKGFGGFLWNFSSCYEFTWWSCC